MFPFASSPMGDSVGHNVEYCCPNLPLLYQNVKCNGNVKMYLGG